jgi:hypothetical protein
MYRNLRNNLYRIFATPIVFKKIPRHGPRRKHSPFIVCCRGMFSAPLHSNSHGAGHIENIVLLLLRALPRNGRCLQSHCLAMCLYATILSSHINLRVPSDLTPSHNLCVCISPYINFWTTWQIFTKFGIDVMLLQATPTSYFSISCNR